MSGHTPGPWISGPYCPRSGWVDIYVQSKRDYLPLASTRHYDANANARLIAAAPELLEALQGLLADMSGMSPEQCLAAAQAARAAIAKATGTPTP